jgi:transcriptional regulator with XRE-family HTH domain
MNAPSPLQRLGGRIRARREAAGLAPSDLAAAAALDMEALAAIEAGRADPDFLTLARLARALGVSVAALLGAMDGDEG